jgi:hypothetical protein
MINLSILGMLYEIWVTMVNHALSLLAQRKSMRVSNLRCAREMEGAEEAFPPKTELRYWLYRATYPLNEPHPNGAQLLRLPFGKQT